MVGVALTLSKNAKPMYVKPTSLRMPEMLIALGPQMVTVRMEAKVMQMPPTPLSKTNDARPVSRVSGFRNML